MMDKLQSRNFSVNHAFILTFLLINVGLYFEEFLSILPISYIVLLLGVFFIITKTKRIVYGQFISYSVIFVTYCFLSNIWAYNGEDSFDNFVLLLKSVIIGILFIQLLRTKSDVGVAFWGLAVSSLIFVLIYISKIDLTQLGDSRIQSFNDISLTLPNINLVGIFGSFAFAFFLFHYFLYKQKLALLLSIISFLSVSLLGSRKSLIIMIVTIIFLFPKLSMKYKFVLTLVISIIIIGILYVIPPDYLDFIYYRFESFLSSSTRDESDETRISLLENSFNFIVRNPFFGSGYYNFASLNQQFNNEYIYSHNNFIETLVGLGVVGFLIYYSIYFKIFKKLYYTNKDVFKFYFIIFFVLLFNHFFIVLTNEKFIWLLLGAFYAFVILNSKSEKQYEA